MTHASHEDALEFPPKIGWSYWKIAFLEITAKNVIFRLLTTVVMTKISFFAQFLAISEKHFFKQKL